MAKALFALVLGAVCLLASGPALADWVPSDGHKMHFPQLPDEQGWDVNASMPVILADDWRCSQTGPVTDVHFWGSWRDVTGDGVGDIGTIMAFRIQFWSDVPSGSTYSHPGTSLWEGEVTNFALVPIDPPTLEAWYDPTKLPEVVVPNDHGEYFQYNLDLTQLPQPPFVQTEGTIYWMSVTAFVQQGPIPYEWGWKSTIDHFNDDAVWAFDGAFQWIEMYEPPRVNNFNAQIDPTGHLVGGGTNAYGQGWYFYPGSAWWNIWFYDNPFTYDHYKRGLIQCQITPIGPGAMVTVALNWSTDEWSLQNPPPEGPPLPGVDEGFIGRQIIWSGPVTGPIEFYEPFDLRQFGVPYNPEWISVDVQGVNVAIMNGVINHECVRTSLDLAFVINGPEPMGACCYSDGTCIVMTATACGQVVGATYAGDGTDCSDNNGNQVADVCEQYLPTGACCAANNFCYVTTQPQCLQAGDRYLGDNTICLGDLDGDGQDEACQLSNTGACCMPDGTCMNAQSRAACVMAGGHYMGDGSLCLGDAGGNGVDDLCEGLPDLKWFQPPDLSPTGMDVNASPDPTGIPYLLASDFLCTQTGPITEIHVFGSWLNDVLPQGDPRQVSFRLSLHPDIPDPDGPSGPEYSRPGPALWIRPFQLGEFEVKVHAVELNEGWYTPPQMYLPIGDHVCFEYIFRLGPDEFIQRGTSSDPIIYWLDVQAFPTQQGTFFGWKTALPPHWNDDAVFANAIDEIGVPLPWHELRYPPMHPFAGQSFDLAFQIWGFAQEPTGACCFDDGRCLVMTQPACLQGGGTYSSDGTGCAGDVNPQNGIDDACEGVVTLGACCYGDPFNPSCVTTTQTICTAPGGLAGTWYAGQSCATFECPSNPEEAKWRQPPDMTTNGLDVMATDNLILADDFECNEPGKITKVVVYGSWWHDVIPDHNTVGFTLSFHGDIPAIGTEHSRPGATICLRDFAPGSYQFEPVVQPGQVVEGWYDPRTQTYEFPGDHNIFKYTFTISDPCWTQTGRNGEPKVYWLDVQARVPSMIETYFGWKTSTQHWNDDATWAVGNEPVLTPWLELRYPPGHPLAPASIDLAFEIYGVLEDCCMGRVGDANVSNEPTDEVSLGDIMLMVDAKYISGDCSKLPCLTEADVNQDGGTNPSCEEHITLGDIMRLVDYLFISGTPLKDCL